jgi:hypothetical protein
MSAKTFSRDFAQGQIKKLHRIRQPLAMNVPLPPPRNPVARAMALRAVAQGAGKHIRSQDAQRRADKVALNTLVRGRNPRQWD